MHILVAEKVFKKQFEKVNSSLGVYYSQPQAMFLLNGYVQ